MTTRIAFPFVGDSIGGSHVSAALLMRHLPPHDFAPIAVVHGRGLLSDWLSDQGLSVLCADLPYLTPGGGGPAAIARLAAIAPRLALFLRRHRFKLVHTNDGRTTTTWMPGCRLAGSKAVAHQRTRWNPSRLAHRMTRMANAIIAISDYVRDSMPDDLKRSAVVVANPFDFDVPSRDAGRRAVESLAGPSALVVAFIGTLQAQKRPDIFLRAAALIHRVRPDVRFLVIGRDGELGARMRQLCTELFLSDVVTFLGFRSDALQLLAGCDLLLAPAVDEGQGRAVVESMVCGVPVIAADSGGQSGIIQSGSTGLLVPHDNTEQLAAAALRILERPDEGRALASAALAWVKATFSTATHARAIAEQYRGLLSA